MLLPSSNTEPGDEKAAVFAIDVESFWNIVCCTGALGLPLYHTRQNEGDPIAAHVSNLLLPVFTIQWLLPVFH